MDLKEIQTFFEENKDNEEVKNYIGGFLTSDRVQQFLENDEGKKILQPKMDSYFTKGLDTWKNNNLNKLIDEEVKKRFPDKDEKDIELENIKAQLAKMESEKTRETLTNKAIKMANEKKLPLEIVDFLVAGDEENTIKNVEKFEQVFQSHVESLVAERLKDSSYVPPGGDSDSLTLEKITTGFTEDEVNKNWETIQKLLKNQK